MLSKQSLRLGRHRAGRHIFFISQLWLASLLVMVAFPAAYSQTKTVAEQPKLEETRNTDTNSLKMPDQSCIQAVQREVNRCVPIIQNNMNTIRQCIRDRLSLKCAKLYESENNKIHTDTACQQELSQASGPCGEKLLALQKQCTHEHLSQDCKDQINSYEKSVLEMQQQCAAAMQRMNHLCGTEKGENYFRCLGQHKEETTAACGSKR